ncbi:MAG: NAD(+)/NADH kinase [Candidatus Omnitrophica bacterium]|nr:NAD(+)/NADH kinase [Candidatus Omnitrophota bacterium]
MAHLLEGNVLLLYKKSAYSIYFRKGHPRAEIDRYKKAHDEHLRTLTMVERVLHKHGINYSKYARGRKIPYQRYRSVITVGGDGTFLEAARNTNTQVLLGVNSAPGTSVGELCVATQKNFERIIRRIIAGKNVRLDSWQRLRLELDGLSRQIDCLNDILICHQNPAAVSRYYLKIGTLKEEQRSSGLWVAAPAGSSGAIQSAGGRILNITEKKFQYMPRELYQGVNPPYRLKGGVLAEGQTIKVTSLMHDGNVFVDGTHVQLAFPFHATLKISLSPKPVKVIQI